MQTPAGLSYSFARDHGVVLLAQADGAVEIGLRQGADPLILIEVRRHLDSPISVTSLTPESFERQLSRVFAGEGMRQPQADEFDLGGGLDGLVDDLPEASDLLDAQDDAPVIRLINGLIGEAVRLGASDVHIEPYETTLLVRLRIDGVLRETLKLNARLAPLLVSRVKVMARLDIAEKRIPQDGRISLTFGGRSLDVRVSTLPAKAGERVVMRILTRDQIDLNPAALGMPAAVTEAFLRALDEPNGIVLITGPTGSGKTTSLYAGLSRLNDQTRNILTVEDPVEYALDGIGQTQVNPKVGMTFAAGLRAILRQDPDVVMVGEIRDAETAQIAVQASLTGHLVLSTVHTNDALGAVTRLRDMGVEPFLLASTLRVIMAQRLVRRLCPHCRKPETIDSGTASRLDQAKDLRIFRAVGCEACNHTGYAGRIGLYEVVVVDETMRRLIGEGADETQMAAHGFARRQTLSQCAQAYVTEGLTTLEEVIRVTRQSDKVSGEGDGGEV